jgi:hypothetical protein
VRRFTEKRRAEIGRDLIRFADKVSLALQMHGQTTPG